MVLGNSFQMSVLLGKSSINRKIFLEVAQPITRGKQRWIQFSCLWQQNQCVYDMLTYHDYINFPNYHIYIWSVIWNIFYFPYIWNNHPSWLSYFSEGLKPPTRYAIGLAWFLKLMVFFTRKWGLTQSIWIWRGSLFVRLWSLHQLEIQLDVCVGPQKSMWTGGKCQPSRQTWPEQCPGPRHVWLPEVESKQRFNISLGTHGIMLILHVLSQQYTDSGYWSGRCTFAFFRCFLTRFS